MLLNLENRRAKLSLVRKKSAKERALFSVMVLYVTGVGCRRFDPSAVIGDKVALSRPTIRDIYVWLCVVIHGEAIQRSA